MFHDDDQHPDRDAALRDLIPVIERIREIREVEWTKSEQDEDGAYSMSYPLYGRDVHQVMAAFDGGPLTDFNYMETARAQLGEDLPYYAKSVAPRADEALVVALITGIFRSERFCDGAIAEALKDGTLAALLDRLMEVRGLRSNPEETDRGSDR